jgi:hypothetical protein
LFPNSKVSQVVSCYKDYSNLLCFLTWVLKELGGTNEEFYFLEKELERERKDIKEKLLSTYIICLQIHQLFFFLGG